MHTGHDGHRRTWATASPYLLRHAPAHAEAAGRLDEILADTEFLVHGDPAALVRAFPRAAAEEALSARAVYRASIGVHRRLDPAGRRRLLYADAVRYRATASALAFDDGIEAGAWTPAVATGGLLSPALRDTMTGHTDSVIAVACTEPAGRPVAVSGSMDGTVRIWDLATGAPRGQPLTRGVSGVKVVACTTLDGRPVAVAASFDETMRIWDLTTGTPHGELIHVHTDHVNAVACAVLEGSPVAVVAAGAFEPHKAGPDDDITRIWDLTTGTCRGRLRSEYPLPVNAVACTVLHGRPVAVTGGPYGSVTMWDLATGNPVGEDLIGHTDSVSAVACTVPAGRPVAATASQDGTVRVWDLTTLACTVLHEEPPTTIKAFGSYGTSYSIIWGGRSVACTVLDGRPVAAGNSLDGTVRVWDLTTGRCIDRIPLPTPCTALAWGPTDYLFVAFDRDIAVLRRKPHDPNESQGPTPESGTVLGYGEDGP